MNKKVLWAVFVKKNPHFADKGASFTANGLKKFFDTAYNQGHDQGFKNGKAYQELRGEKGDPSVDFLKEAFGI